MDIPSMESAIVNRLMYKIIEVRFDKFVDVIKPNLHILYWGKMRHK